VFEDVIDTLLMSSADGLMLAPLVVAFGNLAQTGAIVMQRRDLRFIIGSSVTHKSTKPCRSN
jgi:hypothetical protein